MEERRVDGKEQESVEGREKKRQMIFFLGRKISSCLNLMGFWDFRCDVKLWLLDVKRSGRVCFEGHRMLVLRLLGESQR